MSADRPSGLARRPQTTHSGTPPACAAPLTPGRGSAYTPYPLVFRRHKPPARERRPIVVCVLHRALGECHLLPRQLLVGDQAEQVTDTVEARAPLVIRGDDVPGRIRCVRGLE